MATSIAESVSGSPVVGDALATAASQWFGHSGFRPQQREIVEASLGTDDVFVLMPTGGGKSLCYQLPAVMQPVGRCTVVVSPLISLIHDQCAALERHGVRVLQLTSNDDGSGRAGAMRSAVATLAGGQDALATAPQLIYLTPERITSSPATEAALTALYAAGRLARFVVDEAHTVSQWGHDFRPAYLALARMRTTWPGVPISAFTATAGPRVADDVRAVLGMSPLTTRDFRQSFNRPLLNYAVEPKPAGGVRPLITHVRRWVRQQGYGHQSGIIYCLSRRDCDSLATGWNAAAPGEAAAYHAGLTAEQRRTTHDAWMAGSVRVICATIAFGMGIDKPDVRYVVHASLPKSLEGYYQESGRAGRDGAAAHCLLLWSWSDHERLVGMIDSPAERRHVFDVCAYCEDRSTCRRRWVLRHFGEDFPATQCAGHCDNCARNGPLTEWEGDGSWTEDAKRVCALVAEGRSGGPTMKMLGDMAAGRAPPKGWTRTRHWGCLRARSAATQTALLRRCVYEGLLCESVVRSATHGGTVVRLVVAAGISAQLASGERTVELPRKRARIQ